MRSNVPSSLHVQLRKSSGEEVGTALNPVNVAVIAEATVPHYEISGYVADGAGNVLEVKRTKANVSGSQTDSQIVAGVALKKIRVLSLAAVCGDPATNITFNSKGAGAGTAISATFQNAANGGEILPRNVDGWFETSAGQALTATTGAGSTTGVQLTYVEI